MLHHLQLLNTGPAPALQLELAPRLNLITGDNSLGKSFLLDVAWYCLTRRWPQELNPGLNGGAMAQPTHRFQEAEISFKLDGESDPNQAKAYQCTFNLEEEAWIGQAGRPVNPALVVYAMADGAFAVWDPARNAWKRKGAVDTPEKTRAYVFSSRQVWSGLPNPQSDLGSLCNGLVQDWASWQRENGEAFAQLSAVLHRLSPDAERPLRPGPLVRISRHDTQDYPTLISPAGPAVPLPHWSSGVKRIIGLAYLLVWAWQEHLKASELLARRPARQMIFLVDEVEAHLHPTWQRRVVKALMEVVDNLNQHTAVQLLLVTHSPLVMASVEPLFDPERDRWWDLDWSEANQQVELTPRPFNLDGWVSGVAWLDGINRRFPRNPPLAADQHGSW
ncbi:MAG: AAA family ATPase [Cyanobacteriota bacterium]|nr:AAA family ATPase [Cyanobacteriota bacterium]